MIGKRIKNNIYKYTRTDWKEIFIVYVGEGIKCPRFYLPLRYDPRTAQRACWLFPFAPFVVIFYILRDSLWLLWHDVTEALQLIQLEREMRNKK